MGPVEATLEGEPTAPSFLYGGTAEATFGLELANGPPSRGRSGWPSPHLLAGAPTARLDREHLPLCPAAGPRRGGSGRGSTRPRGRAGRGANLGLFCSSCPIPTPTPAGSRR